MKKILTIALMAAISISALTACGNDKTTSISNLTVATSDEAVVEDATVATLAETDQAVVDAGLTVDSKGNVVDKNGNKVETTADGKVKVKTADGKTVKVNAAAVKTANENKAKVDAANRTVVQQTNSSANLNGSAQQSKSNAQASSGKTAAQTNKASTGQQTSATQSSKTNTNQQSSTAQSNRTNTNQQSSDSAQTSTNHSQSSQTQPTTVDPHAGKTYHAAVYKTVNHPAETKQVKVVDQEAYSYEEPVYEWKRIGKCKDCGANVFEMSDEEQDAHAEAHVLAGGDGGWYTTTEQVQVGTRTVNVPEKSHMETRVVKEAWTEQVLVKAAGWY